MERKAVVLESRQLGEGLTREVRLLAMGAEWHVDKLVRNTLFGGCQSRAPQ